MNKNVGNIDRLLRVVVGIALIAMVFVGPRTQWGWVGLIPLVTAAMSWCPLYNVLGITTCTIQPVVRKRAK
jgi:hypothetical protein